MFEGTKFVVNKVENGFKVITQVVDADGVAEREYVYPTFDALITAQRKLMDCSHDSCDTWTSQQPLRGKILQMRDGHLAEVCGDPEKEAFRDEIGYTKKKLQLEEQKVLQRDGTIERLSLMLNRGAETIASLSAQNDELTKKLNRKSK